ncbi:MAG: DsbA family protein [Nitrospinaceae bacterium]
MALRESGNGMVGVGFSFMVGWLFLCLPVWADDGSAANVAKYSANPLVALVDEQPIRLDYLRNARIHKLRVQLHQMQKRILKEKALEVLVKKHPELSVGKVKAVEKKDIAAFFKATVEVRTMGTLAQMEGNIRQYLQEMNHAAYLGRVDREYGKAVKMGWVQDFFAPPNEFELVAGVGTAMRWFKEGPDDERKIFILEYSDFQCPFCRRVQSTLRKLRERFGREVQFGYRHFPLAFHKSARRLAEAVECARDQNKFWEVQTMVFDGSEKINGDEQILRLVEEMGGLDMPRFVGCWASGKYRDRVQKDIEEGLKIGINGTPTFIVGKYDPEQDAVSGEMFSGAVSEDKFVRVINKYLAQVRQKVAEPCVNC